ncbi:MAG: acyl-CoA thioesterase [Firmicutes bacterium]|nr:acyl-CoA thioesterase [Bacillota bacterium]
MGVVHHSKYFCWFEEARTDLMAKNGILYRDMEAMGVMMPVTKADCKYKKGAKYFEKVYIHTRVEKFGGAKMVFAYDVKNQEGDTLVTGSTEHCFVDDNFAPVNLKKYLPSLYEKLEGVV